MDVRTLMQQAVINHADRECIVHDDRRMTFKQAWHRGAQLANALLDLGLEPGDRVGVLEDNSIEAADFFHATAIANLVRVPLYPRNGIEAHTHMLSHTGCRALVVSEHYLDEVDQIQSLVPTLSHLVVRDDNYESWLGTFPESLPDVVIDPEDPFIIRHTGGTTGPSKGVAYTHRAWLHAGRDWFYTFPPVLPGDKCLHLGPISHGSGYQYLPTFLSGGANVMMDHFDAEATLDIMERESIGFMFVVPTMLNAIVRDNTARGRRFNDLKCMLVGAAPIADATALAAREVFGDVLYQGYGQTEVLPIAMMGPAQWFAEIEGSSPLRACGMPLPFAQIDIWDEADQPLPRGEVGEIVARADGQMVGFWENETATRERIVRGWVKTGDMGRLDDNGYLYIVDRADDMIISGGYNIWPMELENVVTDFDGVIEVAVFGVPHEKWGESPHVVCVIESGCSLSEDEVMERCAERLGSYKKPSGVTFTTDPLPKSPVGKVMRKTLREPFWEGRETRVSGS